MSRRLAREKAMQILFALDVGKNDIDSITENILEDAGLREEDEFYIREIVRGTMEKLQKIDEEIARTSENWDLKRISAVARAVIRLAVFEIIYLDTVPNSVAINEAVELAKIFDGHEAAAFVNGVLDKIRIVHEQQS